MKLGCKKALGGILAIGTLALFSWFSCELALSRTERLWFLPLRIKDISVAFCCWIMFWVLQMECYKWMVYLSKKKKKSFNLVVLSEQCICERNFLHCALKFLMCNILDVGGKKWRPWVCIQVRVKPANSCSLLSYGSVLCLSWHMAACKFDNKVWYIEAYNSVLDYFSPFPLVTIIFLD